MTKAKKSAATAEADSFDDAIAAAEPTVPAASAAPQTPAPAPLSPVAAFFAQCRARSDDDGAGLVALAKANPQWASHVDSDGFNALTLALLAKKHALADVLIDLGSDPNCTSKGMGWNPLTVAAGCLEGDDAIARKLLAKGADPCSATHMGLCAITAACTYGNLGLVKILLDAGAQATPEKASWLPIIAAAGSSNQALVELLVERGADVNSPLSARNRFGSLHQAVKSGDEGMVKLLISKGADVAAMTHEGETALHYAAERGLSAVAKILVKAGAPTHAENIFGKIPADLAPSPALAAALAPKAERAKHPLSGRKAKKAIVVGDVPEPGIKAPASKKTSKPAPKAPTAPEAKPASNPKPSAKSAPSKAAVKKPAAKKPAMKALAKAAAAKIASKPKASATKAASAKPKAPTPAATKAKPTKPALAKTKAPSKPKKR